MLAVNVSFLPIPGTTSTVDAATPDFVASLCSTVTSIGCIIVGLLLVNEDHTNPKDAYTVSTLTMYCAETYYSSLLFIVV